MTAIEKRPDYVETAIQTFGQEKFNLLRDTICAGLSDGEMSLFIELCNAKKLDPFARQIHAIKRKQKSRVKKGNQWVDEWTEKMTIVTGIDGFRVIAQRTGQYEGQEGPFWCGEDGVWKDVWLEKKAPKAAKVSVHRKGFKTALTGIALWDEYAQTFERDGVVKYTGLWGSHPSVMLAKVAEAIALRRAFPEDLSGLYSSEEMKTEDLVEEVKVKMEALEKSLPAEEPPKEKPKELVKSNEKKVLEKTQPQDAEIVPSEPKRSAVSLLLEFKRQIDQAGTIERLTEIVVQWAPSFETMPARAAMIGTGYARAVKAEMSGDTNIPDDVRERATQMNDLAKE